jgi:hypothetical protein
VTAFFWAMVQALKQERAEGKDEAPFIWPLAQPFPGSTHRSTILRMCGRVIQSSNLLLLSIVDGLDLSGDRLGNLRPRYNAAPGQELLDDP